MLPGQAFSLTFGFGAQELHGDAGVRSVATGNGMAEVLGQVVIPFAEWCGLRPSGEQPGSSLLWKWEGLGAWKKINIINSFDQNRFVCWRVTQ